MLEPEHRERHVTTGKGQRLAIVRDVPQLVDTAFRDKPPEPLARTSRPGRDDDALGFIEARLDVADDGAEQVLALGQSLRREIA